MNYCVTTVINCEQTIAMQSDRWVNRNREATIDV